MFTRITLDRLYAGSVYKLIFTGLLCAMLPLAIIFGVLATFGANTVTWNGQTIYGVMALVVSPLIGLLSAGIFTLFLGTSCVFGLWLFSKFKPLSLWVKNVKHHPGETL
jgi:hypothetical protein